MSQNADSFKKAIGLLQPFGAAAGAEAGDLTLCEGTDSMVSVGTWRRVDLRCRTRTKIGVVARNISTCVTKEGPLPIL